MENKPHGKHLKKWVLAVIVLAVLAAAGAAGWNLFVQGGSSKPAAAVTVTATPEAAATPEPTPEVHSMSLFMAGDGLIHGTVWMDAQQIDGSYDFHSIMENMGTVSSGYDLVYYNQETILGGTELGLSGYPTFNSPQGFGDTMVDLGFNLVSTANNHSLDQGETGIERSTAYWKKQNETKGTVMAGTYDSQTDHDALPVYEKNGITYCFLSWTYGCNGLTAPEGKEYLVNVYSDHVEELLDQIRRAREQADAVLVAMHWGTEYDDEANEEQKALAQQMADAGAAVIIGCHPHVIQPIEYLNNGSSIVYYSLGNMVSAQDQLPRLIGMIGGVTITKTTANGETSIAVSDARADLIYTYYENFTNFKVIPFKDLDDAHLSGYQEIYDRYAQKITEYDSSIQFGGFQ
ncbi:MAG: CapA family protein [Erysipelotrichia bacterium]|nr:CapA family protein [Erysipelotrichia bacterium]